jgi:hypothetical protein
VATTIVTRGSTIIFTSNFFDVDGEPTNPTGAHLYILYRDTAGVEVTDEIVMAQSGNDWSASWESSLARGPHAEWHVRSTGSNKAAHEGVLKLKTNRANPI